MRFAYIGDKKIHISEYTDEMASLITCPEGHKLVAKRGTVRSHHFSHMNVSDCSHENNKGEWHIAYQNRALFEYQEVRLINEGKIHIADTLIPDKKVVIEYQHSPMNITTMREREKFYTSLGYHLVWVFDVFMWEYYVYKSTNIKGVKEISLRITKGNKYPLDGAYQGKVTKILDFGKRELLVVTNQKGNSITGKPITMEEFDDCFIGSCKSKDNDIRPFHHPLAPSK